jgi:hypothetical protein
MDISADINFYYRLLSHSQNDLEKDIVGINIPTSFTSEPVIPKISVFFPQYSERLKFLVEKVEGLPVYMMEGISYLKLNFISVNLISRPRFLVNGYPLSFSVEEKLPAHNVETELKPIEKKLHTFDKYRFVPVPSIPLFHESVIKNGRMVKNPSLQSVVMGGRNLCSLVHPENVVNPPPQTITYDREYICNTCGYVKIFFSFFFFRSSIHYFYFDLKQVIFPTCPVTDVDPVYFSLCLYSLKNKRKLTEDFYVDGMEINSAPLNIIV